MTNNGLIFDISEDHHKLSVIKLLPTLRLSIFAKFPPYLSTAAFAVGFYVLLFVFSFAFRNNFFVLCGTMRNSGKKRRLSKENNSSQLFYSTVINSEKTNNSQNIYDSTNETNNCCRLLAISQREAFQLDANTAAHFEHKERKFLTLQRAGMS